METEIRIQVPEGMEIDKENSTFECIKFRPKKITYFDVTRHLSYTRAVYVAKEEHKSKCLLSENFSKLPNILMVIGNLIGIIKNNVSILFAIITKVNSLVQIFILIFIQV